MRKALPAGKPWAGSSSRNVEGTVQGSRCKKRPTQVGFLEAYLNDKLDDNRWSHRNGRKARLTVDPCAGCSSSGAEGAANFLLVGGEANPPKELRNLKLYSLTEMRDRFFSLVTEVHMSHIFPVLGALKEERKKERKREREKERKEGGKKGRKKERKRERKEGRKKKRKKKRKKEREKERKRERERK